MHYPEVVLQKGSERALLQGHPWVYSGAVARCDASLQPGALVAVRSHRGQFVASGYYNPHSSIRVRTLSRTEGQALDAAFFRAAIERAYQLRRHSGILAHTDAFRLVHGESDGLPGLIADWYAGFLVVQFHTLGMEHLRPVVLDALWIAAKPRGIFERSDVGTRRADGLSDRPSGPLRGEEPPDQIPISEHGVHLFVDVRRGQKTGFFLDQRDNRFLLQQLAGGQDLINCFAYTGGFSAHALKGGARRTLDVDVSPQLAPSARQNTQANCPAGSTAQYLAADLFPFLDELAERGPRFDIVVLDPPALLRKSADLDQAMGVYTKLNRNALRLVREGGLLVSASCSARVSPEDFFQVIRRAAQGARVTLRLAAFNQHPPDHPIDPAFPEGRYLKCAFARVFRH
ncbi:MAG: class I SAM-dependent rRNA methyltransferase [Candidatus Handelsmanbacteria bacterium]|nr:class I SAM-dependent rRNA methyltransferase [Candidatus Handelsmanbacteria bacterium]